MLWKESRTRNRRKTRTDGSRTGSEEGDMPEFCFTHGLLDERVIRRRFGPTAEFAPINFVLYYAPTKGKKVPFFFRIVGRSR